MGEPAELSESDGEEVRRWADRFIDAVRCDRVITWGDIMGGVDMSKESATYATLVRAQVIADSVSRSRLADALESELFELSGAHSDEEMAKRDGWNMATLALVKRLREGFTP